MLAVFLSLVLASCTTLQQLPPVLAAPIEVCSPNVIEEYFQERPMQSVLFQRPDMGAFLSQFEVCKHEFVLSVPTFKTVDGRDISLPYKITIDTTNRTAPSGCVRRESVRTLPIRFVIFCFDDDRLVQSGGEY